MKLNSILLGMSFAVATSVVAAAELPPVIDVSKAPSQSIYSENVTEQFANLERKLDARNKAQVNVQRQLDELQTEVNELRGVSELHSHQLKQVLERQRELYQELDRRVTEALKPKPSIPTTIVAPNITTASGDAFNYSDNLTENDAYDRAVNMVLKEKLYEKAIPEFQMFNQKYPESSYAANAHYWLGQLLFNKAAFSEAKVEFQLVVDKYQDSSKRSDAMLKLAMVEQKLNNKPAAIALYQKLITEYPTSSAAQLAQPRLESFK